VRPTAAGARPDPSRGQLSGVVVPLGLLGLLGVQFLLGMAVNLFVQLSSSGTVMTEMMDNGLLVGIHMMLGMILVAGGMFGCRHRAL
jgi:hypothetical protein